MSDSIVPADAQPSLPPRTAIVHDWFQGLHGSERVVDAVRTRLFPPESPPDVFTFHADRHALPPALGAAIVRESRLAHAAGRRWRHLLPYMPFYFRRLDLDAYDLVVSSSHAFASHAQARPDAVHVVYCHTPPRYVWLPDLDERRPGALAAVGLRALRGPLRSLDRRAAQRPDLWVANSTAVRDRIRMFYGRDSVVVHPPVDVDDFEPRGAKEAGRFLWVHRLIPYKRPQLVVEAFRGLPEHRLTMVGVGPLEHELRRTLPPNVELLGWLPRHELAPLFERASGFVHVAEEDFGISMVEALAAGTPVVALDRGGARDIVRDGIDGVLLQNADVSSLRAAVETVSSRSWDADALARRAHDFSAERFARALADEVARLVGGSGGTRSESW